MKKYILIASIALIAVLNFTLVKSKTGEVTLKSITELAQANASGECPNDVITGPFQRITQSQQIFICEFCHTSYMSVVIHTHTYHIYNTWYYVEGRCVNTVYERTDSDVCRKIDECPICYPDSKL